MKKTMWLWLVMFVVLSMGSSSFAEEIKSEEGKYPLIKKCLVGAEEKTVVATSDGGIVIVTGNKITKYDKNLTVVKETEIKVDADAMKNKMAAMKKMCPIRGDVKSDSSD